MAKEKAGKTDVQKEVTVIDEGVFSLSAINQGVTDLQDNLDQIQIILPQIKIIHQGQMFEMPDGSKKESFGGVILDFNRVNAYWPKALGKDDSPTGDPPACFSMDNLRPSPLSSSLESDLCVSCPQNKPGSDPKGGRGRACKNKMRVHIIMEKSQLLPYRLMLSGANLQPFSRTISTIAAMGKSWRGYWYRFGLVKAKGGGGQEYSEILIAPESLLPEGQADISRRMSNSMVAILRDTASMASVDVE